MRKLLVLLFVNMLLLSASIMAQNKIDSTEITSSVPELFQFHDVIYVIWHEAYPSKDIAALKGMVEKIKPDMDKINNAKLPGILKDKESKWNDGLKMLNASVENYYAAAKGTDDQVMLDAAEKLHADYEKMVRVLKPVSKEVDEYHKDLYVIFHKFYPAKDYKSIEPMMDGMIAKAEACLNAKLPKRLEPKTEVFQSTVKELVAKTTALKEALKTNDSAVIDKAVDIMHSKYQDVEKIFE
ncbi:MAG: hypothetical protein WCK13_04440 [Ignavibacteriota bacterium]